MGLNHVYPKKDKRLLVLLALGALVMFSDLAIPAKYKPADRAHFWLEIQDAENNRLYRFDSPGDRVNLNGKVMIAAKNSGPVHISDTQIFNDAKQGMSLDTMKELERFAAASAPISPRLAYFLGQPFSINIADGEDLTLIPGVGPVLAGNIIAYREMYGPVTEPDQLEDIPGIGPRMKLRLLNYLPCSRDCE